MDEALTIHRLHFAFTIAYHYIFPQLTLGLAPLVVVLKLLYLRKGDERYNTAARFVAKILAITFLFGVITGIPMEFQFGTNWARFSRFAGGVIGQTLAMEGMFAFFLESSFLGLFLFGEKRLGRVGHTLAAIAVFLGSWLSGFFITATDAWMQHPVGYEIAPDGSAHLVSFAALVLNPWAWVQYAHTMGGAFVTGSFAMAALGAFYVLSKSDVEYGKLFLRVGITAALVASLVQLFPTGDLEGQLVARYQPVTLAAMEGLFETTSGAGMVLAGQPNVAEGRLDNPVEVPGVLSLLTYKRWDAEVKGLDDYPADERPDNVALLYYSYHIMVGLGTIFVAIMLVAGALLWRRRLVEARWMLWVVMLAFPFPFIANTAGWITAEVGRQPWLVYGLMRTSTGFSPTVSAGNGIFTLLGFMGLYVVLSILFLFLMWREIEHGPAPLEGTSTPSVATEQPTEPEPAMAGD
jgi:cytochrome bd ubiquinol oxidase subunit I